MKKISYDTNALAGGVCAYVFIALFALSSSGRGKPRQMVRDMFNPVSNGYHIVVDPNDKYFTISEDAYFFNLIYDYNPDYIGKFKPMTPWYLNMFGAATGLGCAAAGFRQKQRGC